MSALDLQSVWADGLCPLAPTGTPGIGISQKIIALSKDVYCYSFIPQEETLWLKSAASFHCNCVLLRVPLIMSSSFSLTASVPALPSVGLQVWRLPLHSKMSGPSSPRAPHRGTLGAARAHWRPHLHPAWAMTPFSTFVFFKMNRALEFIWTIKTVKWNAQNIQQMYNIYTPLNIRAMVVWATLVCVSMAILSDSVIYWKRGEWHSHLQSFQKGHR